MDLETISMISVVAASRGTGDWLQMATAVAAIRAAVDLSLLEVFCLARMAVDYFLLHDSSIYSCDGWLFYGTYCLAAIAVFASASIMAIRCRLKMTVVRKVFHVLALVIFLPGMWWYPGLLSLLFDLMLLVGVMVEAFRLSGSGEAQRLVHRFLSRYDDGKDSMYILTHLYLMIGCVYPMYYSQLVDRHIDERVNNSYRFCGVILIGVCDMCASVVGSSFGRVKIYNNKSLEGFVAFVISGLAAGYLLDCAIPPPFFIAMGLVELFSAKVDNLLIPMYSIYILRWLHSL